MTGAGAPQQAAIDGSGLKITIVAGQWHQSITEGLLAGARRTLLQAGAEVEEIRVSGSFELPVVAKAVLDAGADAVVALGVIIRGGTPHFEYVSRAATDGLSQVSIMSGKPVGFGVLTLDDEQQGLDRAGLAHSKEDKGREAAEAALATAITLRKIRNAIQS